jgi:hypothetical protein
MYWQARAMELEAMVERMAGYLKKISELTSKDHVPNKCNYESLGACSCEILIAREALKAYAAMKGVPSASKEEIQK